MCCRGRVRNPIDILCVGNRKPLARLTAHQPLAFVSGLPTLIQFRRSKLSSPEQTFAASTGHRADSPGDTGPRGPDGAAETLGELFAPQSACALNLLMLAVHGS